MGSSKIVSFLCIVFVSEACRLDSSLHGTFKRQSQSTPIHNDLDTVYKEIVVFDEIFISATSISDYGDCYEKAGESYIFGLRRMGRPVCYRCVTPILLSANILQLAHQREDICYDTIKEARSSCYDSTQAGLADGTIVFKSENRHTASCGIDGLYSVGYALKAANLTCEVDGGTTSSNCELPEQIEIQFRNCTFPDFNMSWKCVGSWHRSGQSYIVIENEENEEFRCGVMTDSPEEISIYFSNDSSCAHTTTENAFEKYTFKSSLSSRPFSPCQFPDWIRGEYDSLSVSASLLSYSHSASASVPVSAHCVQVVNDRVLVYSETKCGEPLGYHCLWFNPRSQNLIEFKTTTPIESSNASVCTAESEFANAPWTTALVTRTVPSACGILGKYRTPADLRKTDCYNVTVECDKPESIKITAYHCASGVVFDSRSYSCLASWKEENFLYMFTTRSKETNSCFVSQYLAGRLYLSSTGAHCIRDFNFTENTEKTIVLEEDTPCRGNKPSKSARRPVKIQSAQPIVQVHHTSPPLPTPIEAETLPPFSTIEPHRKTNEIRWIWENNSLNYYQNSIYVIIFMIMSIL